MIDTSILASLFMDKVDLDVYTLDKETIVTRFSFEGNSLTMFLAEDQFFSITEQFNNFAKLWKEKVNGKTSGKTTNSDPTRIKILQEQFDLRPSNPSDRDGDNG